MTTNFNNKFIISGNNIGIGVSNPTDKLSIDGTLSVSSNVYIGGNSTINGELSVSNINLETTLSIGQTAYISERIMMGGTNITIGNDALLDNTSDYNVAIGYQAGDGIISGYHTLVGYQAGQQGEGDDNIGMGYQSLSHVSGSYNIGAGNQSLFEVIGHDNTVLGASGGKKLQGSRNIIVGNFAAISGSANRTIVMGYQAGKNATTSKSVLIGYQAGISSTGHDNVFLGYQAGSLRKTENNTLTIGNESAELIHGNFVSGQLNLLADVAISGNTTISGKLSVPSIYCPSIRSESLCHNSIYNTTIGSFTTPDTNYNVNAMLHLTVSFFSISVGTATLTFGLYEGATDQNQDATIRHYINNNVTSHHLSFTTFQIYTDLSPNTTYSVKQKSSSNVTLDSNDYMTCVITYF